MSEQPQDAAMIETEAKKRPERTSMSVATDILLELQVAWHEDCTRNKTHISQQEFTDSALREYLDSRKTAL